MSSRLIRLAILDGYKVRWDRATIARDVVQNFFDEVEDFREVTVDVDKKRRTVEVRGPSTFDIAYLRYIGATTKREPARRTAGGFGEGFKVCALVLLRDYGCELEAGSGSWELRPRLEPMKLGRELCYAVRRVSPSKPGSFVRIRNADARLCDAFIQAKEQFRHPDNPRLQQPFFVDHELGVGLYEPPSGAIGDVFYRRQHRGTIRFRRGAGLSFAFDGRLDELEGDRDRRNLRAALPIVRAIAKKVPNEVLERVIRHLRVYWSDGNAIVTAFAREAARRGLKLSFGRRFLARVKLGYKLEPHAEKVGYHLARSVFGEIGMTTVEQKFGADSKPRDPTPAEAARMGIAVALYRELTGRAPMFTSFQVTDVPALLDLPWGYDGCAVPKTVLVAPFAEGIAPALAALARVHFGNEENNGDRLTAILDGVLAKPDVAVEWAARWDRALAAPDDEPLRMLTGKSRSRAERRLNIAAIWLYGPSGFPPFDEFEQRIQRIAEDLGVEPIVSRLRVDSEDDAFRLGIPGVPTYWFNYREVAPGPKKPGYFVRSYDGGPDPLTPSDEVIRRALLSKQRRSPKLEPRVYLAYLKKHDPKRYREQLAEKALGKVNGDDWKTVREFRSLRELDKKIAKSRLLMHDEASFAARAADELQTARVAIDTWLEEVFRSCSELRAAKSSFATVAARVEKAIDAGVSLEATKGEAIALAPSLVAIESELASVPLDDACRTACLDLGHDVFLEAYDASGDASPKSALEVLSSAVAIAYRRHDARDERGEPLECSEAREAIEAELGRTREEPEDPIEREVRAAWDEAIAAGASPVEAAARCLEAAARESDRQRA